MKSFLQTVFLCRRTIIAVVALICLTVLGVVREHDVSEAIAAVAIGLAAANSYERSSKARAGVRYGGSDVPV